MLVSHYSYVRPCFVFTAAERFCIWPLVGLQLAASSLSKGGQRQRRLRSALGLVSVRDIPHLSTRVAVGDVKTRWVSRVLTPSVVYSDIRLV
jgi:hypothetical protein